MSENYFQNLPSRTKLNDLTLSPIIVDGVSYNFTDYIENEVVSDFPTYSQRVRNIAKNVATTVDSYLTETDTKLKQMEITLNDNINTFKESKVEEIRAKLNDIDSRISQFDNLRQGTEATDTNLGFITLNKVRELANASMNEDRVRELALNKIQEFGIGLNKPIKKDMNSFLSNGLYSINSGENRIRGKSTSFINFQYDTDWGIQLGLTEEDNPTVNVRSKRDGRWGEWELLAKQSELAKSTLGLLGVDRVHNLTTNTSVQEGNIYLYNNKYYKCIKNGVISTPNDEYLDELKIGTNNGVDLIKKFLSTL